MFVLDHKKGGGKTSYKTSFLPPLLERRRMVRIRERPDVKKSTIFTRVCGGP